MECHMPWTTARSHLHDDDVDDGDGGIDDDADDSVDDGDGIDENDDNGDDASTTLVLPIR